MKNYVNRIFSLIIISISFLNITYSQDYKIIKSDDTQIILEFDFSNKFEVRDTIINGIKFTYILSSENQFRKPGDPFLPLISYEIGIPMNKKAVMSIQDFESTVLSDKFIIPTPDSVDQPLVKLNYNQDIYAADYFFPMEVAEISSQSVFRFIKIASLSISPFQFNPVGRTLQFSKRIVIRIDFKQDPTFKDLILPITDSMTKDLIQNNVINSKEAIRFLSKIESTSDSPQEKYWYDPNKTYYKIYLGEKGVYRISYDLLVSFNIPINGVEINKLQIFNSGIEIPLYIKDADNNELFNSGDYLEFVGFPPPATQYSYYNIYNTQNIYWFSFQADSIGKRYTNKDGYPVIWVNSFATTPFVQHFEKDTLYERLGHAINDQRDYWYWGKSSGTNGNLTSLFSSPFSSPSRLDPNATQITIRVNMHGMTTNQCINPDHKVKVSLTSQLIGEHTWDGPNSSTFQTVVNLSQINIYPENNFQVAAYGDIDTCDPNNPNEIRNDEIRVNWFEIEYPREHRAFENHFNFVSPSNVFNLTRFSVFNWQRDNIKIFIPQKSEMIINANITNDEFKNVFFVDNLNERKEYFCTAEDYYLLPDSIVIDRNSSDLRNNSNGVDYLIITHSKLLNAANELAEFRRINFPDSTIPTPRIQVVNIDDIYDEFSFGLLNPYALKDFITYAFSSWISPSLTYVVLLGDMSYDYRSILPNSRPNFMPSLPYHVQPYGQAVSDNNFVSIVGNDIIPDLAIGRLSCETVEEAAILIEKIKSYPNDPGKNWKQNILLISSGQDQEDEDYFQFNKSNLDLDNIYLKPNGLVSEKVFRFPSDSTQVPYQGGGPEIRQGFNNGAVVANYYGHGGGYQWDLVFNNDDIFLLQNENRLPFITSVTCYTAHFDNQDVFGEQFNKVPGKGCVAFWGSSGLTFWYAGKQLNDRLFRQLFTQKVHVIGKAILNAKSGVGNNSQVALLTLLGDPILNLTIPDGPDFAINSSNISIIPKYPQKNDTISIFVKVNNLGITFPNQSVSIELLASSPDTTYSVDTLWISDFGEIDSIQFTWYPEQSGVYDLELVVNEINPIAEMDYTDNHITTSLIVYDLDEPNIIKPIDGFIFNKDSVTFIFVDPGYYSLTDLDYYIEIDTSQSFTNPILKSGVLKPADGILMWQPFNLDSGLYFWRSRMLSVDDSSNWSETRIFSIADSSKLGYYVAGKHLESLSKSNLIYSDSLKSLVLNVDFLPPRPTNDKLLEFINIALPSDLTSLSAITTDGTFIYVGHMAYYSGVSKIYKYGTGFNGTIAGQSYGEIPNLLVPIWHSMIFYPDQNGGSLYIATGDAYSLLKVNPINGDTSRVNIPEGLLNSVDSRVRDGAFYLNTDGKYIYNVAYISESSQLKYKVRIFDPSSNWTKLGADLIPNGSSYNNFAGFFVAEDYFYPYENFQEGWLRRINLQTGDYEEEWRSFDPFQGFYAWVYDWINDVVYASVFQTNYSPKIAKFVGNYLDAFGSVSTAVVGPANKWDKFYYDIYSENSDGYFSVMLQGLNKNTKSWDTLAINVDSEYDLSYLDDSMYQYLKSDISVVDSSYGLSSVIKIKSIGITYSPPAEIMISNKSISFQPDTILQGLNTILKTRISNIGYSDAKNIKLDYFISDNEIQSDTALFVNIGDINKFSEIEFIDTINTTPYLFENILKIQANFQDFEFFPFNNLASNFVYVARDSINPLFNITFDGREIINGDIISSEPEVVITLEDNSPLPLDSTYFTIVHTYNNIPKILNVPGPDVTYEPTPYPNSRAVITWKPKLEDGRHVLEVLAKGCIWELF